MKGKTLCYECEKEIPRADGGNGAVPGFLINKAKVCKKCYENHRRNPNK